MKCKVCQSESVLQFKTTVLRKYDVAYFKCKNCNLIQTENPYWLPEAYEEAITDLDIGYVTRNISLAETVGTFIRLSLQKNAYFIDYGGGYGLFVRLLRDKGFNFYRQDLHCKNIFALNFDVTDFKESVKFELLTAFEVFEHLESPLEEIEKMFNYSDSILFSTVLQPAKPVTKPEDWWYVAPETGQHIALYHRKTLEHISKIFSCNLYSDGDGLHLLTKRKFIINPVKIVSFSFAIINRLFSRHFNNKSSLINKDFHSAKKLLNQKIAVH
jgi:hypothetical protein